MVFPSLHGHAFQWRHRIRSDHASRRKRASTFPVALRSISLNLHKGGNFLRRTHTASPNSVHLVVEIVDCGAVAQLRSWPFSSVWVSFKGIFRVGLDRHHTRRRDRSETRHRQLIGGNINARNRRNQSQAPSPYLIFEYYCYNLLSTARATSNSVLIQLEVDNKLNRTKL